MNDSACTQPSYVPGSMGRLVWPWMINNFFMCVDSPLSPNISVTTEHLFNDTFVHTIQWDKPFTWVEFPIISYELNITNHSLPSGETTLRVSVLNNMTSAGQQASESNLTHTIMTAGSDCYRFDIDLSAVNSIGESDSSTMHTGHPIGNKEIITYSKLS